MRHPFVALLVLGGLFGCTVFGCAPELDADIASKGSSLTAAQRRVRAGEIRDAAAANGMTQGWLLAGIADAETSMSHCWSELTWACQGPNSADCGGGPVVAGAGDGACSLRQGGLGMFQFDAGTYDQTIAREGTRVLSIAGNVAAAVDFVVAMVIRSVYISGVDNRDQAIAWMNGVRVGNGQWHPWIQTVTHYYNGCTPSGCSVYTSRYNNYRDKTSGVYNEMGAAFWVLTRDYAATYVNQTFPLASAAFNLYPGQESAGYIEMRNAGTATWRPGETFLGTTEPRDVSSPIAGTGWVSPSRAATIDHPVAPGETGRFSFSVRGPAGTGDYPQFFNLVQEGVTWFSQQGGPADNQLQVRVTVVAPPPCPAGTSEAWSCEGSDRVRCQWGEVTREPCEHGCAAGECQAAPVDMDGDGAIASADCDDASAVVYPGAPEVCEDGVDQDCDGFDLVCGVIIEGDAGTSGDDAAIGDTDGGVTDPTRPRTGRLSGGCSAAPGAGTSGALVMMGLAMLAILRRRR